MYMKLSGWVKQLGITYQAAWKRWKAGKLPVEAAQMPTGTSIVKEQKTVQGALALYARISSHYQKKDMDVQLGRLSAYAASNALLSFMMRRTNCRCIDTVFYDN